MRTEARRLAVATLVGVLGALFVTVDIWRAPASTLAGDWAHPDMLGNHWVYVWVADQVRQWQSLLHNDAYYVPVGDAPFLAGNASGALLSAPFLWVLGWPLGLNLYVLVVMTLNVVAAYALARVAGAAHAPALLAGTGYGFCPYLLSELGAARFAQMPAWELAAGLALWIVAIRGGSWRYGMAAGAVFGLGAVEYFYYGLFGALAGGMVLIAAILAGQTRWVRVAIGGAVGGGLTAGPMLVVFLHGWNTVVGATEAGSTFPHPHTLQASLPVGWPVWTDLPAICPQYASWFLLGLALVEWRLAKRSPDGWVQRGLMWTGLAGWLLSLGPQLVTPLGTAPGSHLPFHWLYGLHPALQRFWWPYRHAIMVALSIAPLGALALSRLYTRLPPRLALLTVVVAIGAVPLELKARRAVVAITTSKLKTPPDWVEKIKALPEGGIADLPAAPDLWIGQQHLTLQTLHGRKLLDGHAMWVDRVRPDAWDELEKQNTFLAELQRYEHGKDIPDDPARVDRFEYKPEDVDAVVALGIRWVVVWDELYATEIKDLPTQEKLLLKRLLGDPVIEEEGISVFDLTKHETTGRVPTPAWNWPEKARVGDGSSRMSDALTISSLVELNQ